MPRKSPPKSDEKPQFERFIEAAKEIGAANSDKDLSATIRKLAHANPTRANESPTSRKKT
jgi:hypothetical protein